MQEHLVGTTPVQTLRANGINAILDLQQAQPDTLRRQFSEHRTRAWG